MLWNIIRDFFVMYVFGGGTSTGQTVYGKISAWENAGQINVLQMGSITMSLADWLSTTATIITLVALVVVLFFLVRWAFRLIYSAFHLRG